MFVEASIPLTVKLPTGDIRLTPGVPVELPREQAHRLLVRAKGKVREVSRDWQPTWRELATLTSGLTANDPRLSGVLDALNLCDDAYLNGDWEAFSHAAARVRRAVSERGPR
jgi:hypothetical protein